MSRALQVHKQRVAGIPFWTLCGIGGWHLTTRWSRVTCKRCLRLRRRQNGS